MTTCQQCPRKASFELIAVRIADGDLIDHADLCAAHSRQAGTENPALLEIPESFLQPLLHDLYVDARGGLPGTLYLCAACSRLADVWIASGLGDDVSLDAGAFLCGPCAGRAGASGDLPEKVREELLAATSALHVQNS